MLFERIWSNMYTKQIHLKLLETFNKYKICSI